MVVRAQRRRLRFASRQIFPTSIVIFDSIPDGTKRFDILGKLVADPQQGGMEIVLETIRGGADPGQDGYQSFRWFRSTLHMKPDEIVEVALPQPDEKAGAFANRVFSIRIRAKQIR